MTAEADIRKLIEDHTPVLVLYPEINSGISRKQDWNGDFQDNGRSPLSFDYHPRDVRLVLEHSIFHEWFRWFRRRRVPTDWNSMLGRMELDLTPKTQRVPLSPDTTRMLDAPTQDFQIPYASALSRVWDALRFWR